MKKVTLSVPWGQYDPIVKKNQNENTVYYNVLFLQIIIHNIGLYWNIDRQRYDFVLGNFEYIQKQTEKYTENVLQSVSNTQEAKNASDSSLLCKFACHYHLSPKCLQYFLWSSFLQTIIYITWRYYGVYLSPSGNKHKQKINRKTQKLANVCDIVWKALRKNT
jgi:hypothetical protein